MSSELEEQTLWSLDLRVDNETEDDSRFLQ